MFSLLAFITPAHANAESYLCVGNKSVGYAPNQSTNKWEKTTFKSDKWIVKKTSWGSNKTRKPEWIVVLFGSRNAKNNLPNYFCGQKDPDKEFGELRCEGMPHPSIFHMSTKTLRYSIASYGGYAMSGPNSPTARNKYLKGGEKTPAYVELGTCSNF